MHVRQTMKIKFLTSEPTTLLHSFVVNKSEFKTGNDYNIIVNLISMIYNSYCIEARFDPIDIKNIVAKSGRYVFKTGGSSSGAPYLEIKSLKHVLRFRFIPNKD